jgi:hypothetical protein
MATPPPSVLHMVAQLEYIWFGDRLLCRVDQCGICGQPSFVENFTTRCCDWEIEFSKAEVRRESEGEGKRRHPSKALRNEILSKQGHRCFYCDREFGSVYTHNKRETVRRINWDHFMPFAYLQTNPKANWVAACNVCNQIKHSRIFYDREEAKTVIAERTRVLGYLDPAE